MQFIRDSKKTLSQSVVTIGNFDGVHKGHQALIHVLMTTSRVLKIPAVLLTFEPLPIEFFLSKTSHTHTYTHTVPRLMRFSEKWNAVKPFGIDYFYCMRFHSQLANLSAQDFVKTILIEQLGVKKIIIGDNFRFGAQRAGDVETLQSFGKKYGFTVDALPQVMYDEERISSSHVRNAVKQGNFEKVIALTGRPFMLSGKVAYGNRLGKQLGFPTANIHLHRKAVPLLGIFVARVHGLQSRSLEGVASIGCRPTFNGKEILLEVFIFDFDEDIYGRFMTIEFLHKIRDEIKFESVAALVMQMEDDVRLAKGFFG